MLRGPWPYWRSSSSKASASGTLSSLWLGAMTLCTCRGVGCTSPIELGLRETRGNVTTHEHVRLPSYPYPCIYPILGNKTCGTVPWLLNLESGYTRSDLRKQSSSSRYLITLVEG
jgi:hypothetical protein